MSNEVKTKTTSLYEQMGGTYTEIDGIFYVIVSGQTGYMMNFTQEVEQQG